MALADKEKELGYTIAYRRYNFREWEFEPMQCNLASYHEIQTLVEQGFWVDENGNIRDHTYDGHTDDENWVFIPPCQINGVKRFWYYKH